ncbi:hypothetical protein PY092_12720 [Muricauda sp. 334s03]|uniref:Uncharacterized protein n=1 Tax=Flagellimonas yonaguniensis TaxID=3031325 RepID=A0ABT5Y0Q4_9FLAO|nr:hypothetical protein [[Muricauda] yonaguniensis]MDF0717018.1 hypothetical protein [[Muricauda] yonaguniensis]
MYGKEKKHFQVDDEKDKTFSHQGIDLKVLGAILCLGFHIAKTVEAIALWGVWR